MVEDTWFKVRVEFTTKCQGRVFPAFFMPD